MDWAARARYKAINEKKASKKTKEGLIHAYRVMKEKNFNGNSDNSSTRPEGVEQSDEDKVQTDEEVEGLQE